MLNVNSFKEEYQAKLNATKKLQTILKRQSKLPILLLLSGGSCLEIIESLTLLNYSKLTIGVLDERITENIKGTNQYQIKNNKFYKTAIQNGAKYLTLAGSKGALIIAKYYERSLKKWKKKNTSGKVIITQGIGNDGHTAGIFSVKKDVFENLFESESWTTEYEVSKKIKFPKRVTATITFLKNFVDESVVYAVGGSKKEALIKTLNNSAPIWKLPAGVIHQMKAVSLFTNLKVS